MSEVKYAKIGSVSEFTILKPVKSYWFKWDAANKKALKSEKWEAGYTQKFDIDTDMGIISFSRDQLQQMFFAARKGLTSDINHKRFGVKTNGKQGIEVRYFLNLIPQEEEIQVDNQVDNSIPLEDLGINVDDIKL